MATSTGYYLYGFTDCKEFRNGNDHPVAGQGTVENVPFKGVGVLCSPVNGKKMKPSRGNLMAHQNILEAWMREFTILPIRFGVVAQSKGALRNGIRSSLPILRAKLQYFRGKRELNIKAFWEKDFIYDFLLSKYPDLKKFRDQVNHRKGTHAHYKKIELGQWVERVLLGEGEEEARAIVEELTPATLHYKKNKLFGELSFLNLAALVDEKTEPKLDVLVNKAAQKREGKARFKYIGPSPPASFVDIHLKF